MDMKLLYYIWLGEKLNAGSSSAKILLEYYKCDIEKIYNASAEEYKSVNIPKGDIEALSDKSLDNAKRYYEYCAKERVGILCYDSSFYPERLKNIKNPPPMFYYRGRPTMLDDYPLFAMVGTRSCSETGYRQAYRIGYEAAFRGAVPVNGIASGIDAAVLKGALDADGYVVVFLGNGIDKIYPASNAELFKRVERRGLVLSEFPPFTKSSGFNFPVRNRCISGVSLATVIFEADSGSGALHTAHHALYQGKPLYAVPGDIDDPLYSGPLELIKGGASPITNADDFVLEYRALFPHRIETSEKIKYSKAKEDEAVSEAFSGNSEFGKERGTKITLPKPKRMNKENKDDVKPSVKPVSENTCGVNKSENPSEAPVAGSKVAIDLAGLSSSEAAVVSLLQKNDFITPDDLVRLGIKIDDALSSLTMLEIYGYIESLPGGRYRLKDK